MDTEDRSTSTAPAQRGVTSRSRLAELRSSVLVGLPALMAIAAAAVVLAAPLPPPEVETSGAPTAGIDSAVIDELGLETTEHGHAEDDEHAATDDHDASDDHTAVDHDDDHSSASPTKANTAGAAHGHDAAADDPSHDPATPADADHAHDPSDPATDPEHEHTEPEPDPSVPLVLDLGPDDRCDLGFNPVAYYRDAAVAGIDVAYGGDFSAPSGAPAMGEIEAAGLIDRLSHGTDAEYDAWLSTLHGGSHTHTLDAASEGHGDHLGPQTWRAMTDPTACSTVADELARARAAALRYPTPREAEAAGYYQVTPYVNGIGAHWIDTSLVDGTFDVDNPEMLLYDGNDKNASIIGLSYQIWKADGEPTVGFTGDNDHYHRHIGLCFNDEGMVIGDTTWTEERCASVGGHKDNSGVNLWMSHAWVVPGCESPWGVFSAVNPQLDWELWMNSGKPGSSGCGGSAIRDRYDRRPATRGDLASLKRW